MATTKTPAQIYIDGQEVEKSDVRQWMNEIDANILNDTGIAQLTLTSSGNGAAYTATGPAWADNVGKLVVFTPDVTNSSGAPGLSINGAKAVAIQQYNSVLGVGRFVPGVPLLLRREAAAWRVVIGAEDGVPIVTGGGSGTAYTGSLLTHSLLGNRRLFVFTPPATNGANATLALNGEVPIPFHGMDARPLDAGYFVTGWGYLCLYAINVVRVIGVTARDRDPALESSRLAQGVANNQNREPLVQAGAETAQIVLVGDSTETIWAASHGELGRTLQTWGTRWIDLRHLPAGSSVPYTIHVAAGSVTKVFNGTTVWTLPAGTVTRIHKVTDGDIFFDPLTGSVTSVPIASALPPAADLTIATAGQSLAKSFVRGAGLYGLQVGLRNYAGPRKNLWIIDSAIGGTPLVSDINAATAWWDTAANGPGPSALAWRDAISAKPANQPPVGLIYINNGQSDVGYMGGLGLTPAKFKSALQSLIAWMRTQIGNNTVPVILSPLGPEDNSASTNQTLHSAVRWAQMEVIAADPNVHLGPAYYDLPRPFGDLHLPRESNMLMGWRMAAIIANAIYGANHPTGPRVDKIEVLDGGRRYRLRIAPHSAPIAATTPADWSNLAILPSGTDPLTGTPGTIDRTYWETTGGVWYYNIVLRDAVAGGTVMFPYGWGWELRAGRFPRNALIDGWGNLWPMHPIQSGAF